MKIANTEEKCTEEKERLMALTRKMLQAMDIDASKIDEIINAHTETVNGLKEEIDKYKGDSGRLASAQKELDDLKAAMSNGEKSPYKVKYEALVEEKNDLQKEFDDYKKGVEEKETQAKKEKAYKALLKEAGVSEKRLDAILKITDLSEMKLDKDGNLDGKDTLLDGIKNEWSDFIVTQGTKGASVANPPANNGGKTAKTRDEIMQIKDTVERQKAWGEFLNQERTN